MSQLAEELTRRCFVGPDEEGRSVAGFRAVLAALNEMQERCAAEAEVRGRESAEMHDLVTPESLAQTIASRIREL